MNRPAAGFVARYLGRLTLAHVGFDGLDKMLNHPSVVWGEKHVKDVCRSNDSDPVTEVPLDNADDLRKKNVRGGLAGGLFDVVAGQGPCQLEDQLLQAAARAERIQVDADEFPWAGK